MVDTDYQQNVPYLNNAYITLHKKGTTTSVYKDSTDIVQGVSYFKPKQKIMNLVLPHLNFNVDIYSKTYGEKTIQFKSIYLT